MQKLKKALKKLANLSGKPAKAPKVAAGASKPAQAAKKAPSSVKKKAPAAAKKAAPKKAPVVAKKTAAKAPAKSAKPAPKAAPKVAAAKAPEKAPAKVADKAKDKAKAATNVTGAAQKVEAAKKPAEKVSPASATPVPAPKAPAKAEKSDKTKAKDAQIAAEAAPADEEVVLTDAEGRRYCRVKDCDQAAVVESYCRYHYLLFWKNIQSRKKILSEGKLERYIEELTARYPDKYLELLRKDLRSEKDFMAAIQELEIDESGVDAEFEDEAQNYLDEVRGMSSETPTRDDEDF